MNRKLHILAVAAVLAFFPSYGQNASSVDIRKHIEDVSGCISSIECDFVQTRHSRMLSEPVVSKGHMVYGKPDFLKWEYTSPFSFSLIVDKGKVSTVSNGVKNASASGQDRMLRELSKLIAGSIDGSVISDGRIFKAEFAEIDKRAVATLFPLRQDLKKLWNKLVIRYNPLSYKAESFEMYESSGDFTVIEFLNSRYEISR